MADRPRVTVRSTCYAHERFVIESLESVARQDFRGIQWVIVDDASPDGSARKIRNWLDRNARSLRRDGFNVEFIEHTDNIGFTRTLNQIVAIAQGDYICGLSCDDRMMPWRVSKSVRLLSRLPAEYAVVYSNAYVIDSEGNRLAKKFIEHYRTFGAMPRGDMFEALLPGNFIPAPTTMVTTEALRKAGPYDESLSYEDYDMWLRLARHHWFAFEEQPLAEYRNHHGNTCKKITDWDSANYWIYRKHRDCPEGIRRFLQHVDHLARISALTPQISQDLAHLEFPDPDAPSVPGRASRPVHRTNMPSTD